MPTYERNNYCDLLESHAAKRGFPEIKCFVVVMDDGTKEYGIHDGKEWLYGSSVAEAVYARIDMMYTVEKHGG